MWKLTAKWAGEFVAELVMQDEVGVAWTKKKMSAALETYVFESRRMQPDAVVVLVVVSMCLHSAAEKLGYGSQHHQQKKKKKNQSVEEMSCCCHVAQQVTNEYYVRGKERAMHQRKGCGDANLMLKSWAFV